MCFGVHDKYVASVRNDIVSIVCSVMIHTDPKESHLGNLHM